MVMKQLSVEQPERMVEMMGTAHYVMKGLMNTLLLVTKIASPDERVAASIGRDAAIAIAGMQRAEADKLRDAGERDEASAMDRGIVEFEQIIAGLFGPAPTKQ